MLAGCKGLVCGRTNLYEGDLEKVSCKLLPSLSLHKKAELCGFLDR